MHQKSTRLKSVYHATYAWRNQLGLTIAKKPRVPTVHGRPIAELKPECQERAMKIQDIWIPVVRLFMPMARVISYQGEKAKLVWREYNAGIYNKKKYAKT